MKNITYLLGAGASYKALPLVNDLKQELLNFKEGILREAGQGPNHLIAKKFADDIYWLIGEIENSLTIDTFAKKLFLQNEIEKLNKLKSIVTLYFINRQATAKSPEKRYEGFFATLLKGSIDTLPSNVKIVSWNYDSQLELSFNSFVKLNSLEENQKRLRVNSKFLKSEASPGEFSIFKLNGTASFLNGREIDDLFFKAKLSASDLNLISEKYSAINLTNSSYQGLSFAWETSNQESDIVRAAQKSIENTDILIIIGYSFPNFNREIDLRLLRAMKEVEKIYIQDLNFNLIKQRLIDARPDLEYSRREISINDREVTQFHIPNDFF
jgi:hypothetical protein